MSLLGTWPLRVSLTKTLVMGKLSSKKILSGPASQDKECGKWDPPFQLKAKLDSPLCNGVESSIMILSMAEILLLEGQLRTMMFYFARNSHHFGLK